MLRIQQYQIGTTKWLEWSFQKKYFRVVPAVPKYTFMAAQQQHGTSPELVPNIQHTQSKPIGSIRFDEPSRHHQPKRMR